VSEANEGQRELALARREKRAREGGGRCGELRAVPREVERLGRFEVLLRSLSAVLGCRGAVPLVGALLTVAVLCGLRLLSRCRCGRLVGALAIVAVLSRSLLLSESQSLFAVQ
jgi:hypothetical protein